MRIFTWIVGCSLCNFRVSLTRRREPSIPRRFAKLTATATSAITLLGDDKVALNYRFFRHNQWRTFGSLTEIEGEG